MEVIYTTTPVLYNRAMSQKPINKSFARDLVKVFVVPTLINKAFLLYFGLNYSRYPGEGYGYGVLASLAFLAFTIGSFLWKYRHEEDP